MSATIKLAVVIGGHAYDVPEFRALFDRMDGCDTYLQDVDNWAASKGGAYDRYDAFLFYHMNYWGKLSVRDDMDKRITDAIAQIGESRQGFVVLHHALLSFRELAPYSALCNIPERTIRGFGNDDIRTEIADADHPITRGLAPWVMQDEYFVIDEPGPGSRVLLTTTHPKSMKPLMWAHEYRNARVVCYQSGHGPSAYQNEHYQTALKRSIEWVARRL